MIQVAVVAKAAASNGIHGLTATTRAEAVGVTAVDSLIVDTQVVIVVAPIRAAILVAKVDVVCSTVSNRHVATFDCSDEAVATMVARVAVQIPAVA